MSELKIKVLFENGSFFGPGKADLLDGIDGTGSIAAACRDMRMSYKRAWTLVAVMNDMFAEPLVVSTRGGKDGGHASLTETGRAVLAAYRRIQSDAQDASRRAIEDLDRAIVQKGGTP